MARRRGLRDDRGETLIELIVALAILGVAGVAILAGVMTSVRASTVHRNESTGGAYVRSFAEAIQNHVDANGLPGCGAAAGVYEGVTVPGLPTGYTKSVTGLQSWTGSTWGPCAVDAVQRVQLTITTTGDTQHRAAESLTVILRRPCTGAATTVGSNPCS